MEQVAVNFRLEKELKTKMEAVCKDMGMTMTTAFTIFAKKVCRSFLLRRKYVTLEGIYSPDGSNRWHCP